MNICEYCGASYIGVCRGCGASASFEREVEVEITRRKVRIAASIEIARRAAEVQRVKREAEVAEANRLKAEAKVEAREALKKQRAKEDKVIFTIIGIILFGGTAAYICYMGLMLLLAAMVG